MFIPSASLEDPNIIEYLTELKNTYLVRGIRQIVNYEPSWPRNEMLGNLFDNGNFEKGFELLGLHNLSMLELLMGKGRIDFINKKNPLNNNNNNILLL